MNMLLATSTADLNTGLIVFAVSALAFILGHVVHRHEMKKAEKQ